MGRGKLAEPAEPTAGAQPGAADPSALLLCGICGEDVDRDEPDGYLRGELRWRRRGGGFATRSVDPWLVSHLLAPNTSLAVQSTATSALDFICTLSAL